MDSIGTYSLRSTTGLERADFTPQGFDGHMLLLSSGRKARVTCHQKLKHGVIGCCLGGNVIHVCLDVGKGVGQRCLMNLMRDGVCATKGGTVIIVGLLCEFGR